MKRFILVCCAALSALCCTACGTASAGGSSAEESSQQKAQSDGLNVVCGESMDQAYADVLKAYFEAIDHQDYAAYQKTVYAPYQESYNKFLESKGSDLETTFREDLCTRFDEDGYDGWTLTELQIEYCPPEKEDLDDFFNAYSKAGIFDDTFVENTKEDAAEMHDIMFTLYALYDGDEEAVPVVTNGEIFVLKNEEGTYLLG